MVNWGHFHPSTFQSQHVITLSAGSKEDQNLRCDTSFWNLKKKKKKKFDLQEQLLVLEYDRLVLTPTPTLILDKWFNLSRALTSNFVKWRELSILALDIIVRNSAQLLTSVASVKSFPVPMLPSFPVSHVRSTVLYLQSTHPICNFVFTCVNAINVVPPLPSPHPTDHKQLQGKENVYFCPPAPSTVPGTWQVRTNIS